MTLPLKEKNDLESNVAFKPSIDVCNIPLEFYEGLEDEHKNRGVFEQLQRAEDWLGLKLGIETEAIERNGIHERSSFMWLDAINMGMLWASGTINLTWLATGFLGTELGLNLSQSLYCIGFGTLLASFLPGYCATFGAATGLRQMSISRYSFGWYPNKLIALINVAQQIGWSASGCISGGVVLSAVANGHLSLIVGIIIISVVAQAVCLMGLKLILAVERYTWIAFFVVILIIYGEVGNQANIHVSATVSGLELAGSILSYLAIVYGSTASWSLIASDYYAHYSADTSRVTIFFSAALGLALPTCLTMMAGAVAASSFATHPTWAAIYANQGIGYALQEMLHPVGFAKFLLVMLVLSSIGVMTLNNYSASISIQQISPWLARIPRFVWSLVLFGIVIAISIAGRNNLISYLEAFASILGYCATSYVVILWLEHVVIRRKFSAYDLEGWNDKHVLPHGFAAGAVFLVSVSLWVVGMSESVYVGPVAAAFGGGGGDVVNELTFIFTLLSYLPLRYFELRIHGK